MRTEAEIRQQISKLENDTRHKYSPANVNVNAPLAMIQVGIDSQITALKWVLEEH